MKILKRISRNLMRAFKHDPKLALATLVFIVALIFGTFLVGFIKAFIIVAIISTGILTYLRRRKRWYKKYGNDPVRRKRRRKMKNLFVIAMLILAILFVIGIGVFSYYIVDSSPEFEEKKLYTQDTSIIYDSTGEVIAKLGRQKRQKITFDQLPQVLIDAVIATEDSRFFQHNGFDLPRFAKASFGQVVGKANAGGGSTITMQVVKNTLTSTNQNVIRKFTDIYLSVFVLEKKYTKEEIIELYVNIPFLGANSYGVEEASQTYFGKHVSELSLSEAALVAGLFQSPSVYNPYSNPELAEKRRSTVLYLMELHGYITKDERTLANSIPVTDLLVSDTTEIAEANPYQAYIDTVVKEIDEKTGTNPYDTSMKVYTTMNRIKQDALNTAIANTVFKDDVAQTGIAVTETKTGAIAAIYGGRNRSGERTYNYATDIVKQIGSTAKPIYDYGPAVEYLNFNELTPLIDEPWTYSGGVSIKNWDGKFIGATNMKQALGLSRNIPALKTFQTVGYKKVLPFVLGLGMSPEVVDGVIYETHAVGAYTGESPLKMAAAYAAFGNGGFYIKPYSVNKIVYINTGKEEIYKPVKKQAMSDSTAFIITDCLLWATNSGLSSNARVSGVNIAAKTGTTNYDAATLKKYKLPGSAINDLWMIAYSPSYSIGIWYGYDTISSDHWNTAGSNRNVVRSAITAIFTEKGETFNTPSSVVKVTVERNSNPISLPSPFTPASSLVSAWFKVGAEPTTTSPKYSILNNVSNLEADTSGSTTTLTWDHTISTSLSDYITANASTIGEVGYNIYRQNSSGALTLLGFTTDKTYSINNVTDGTTFLVKSTYSLSKDIESSGTSVTVTIAPLASFKVSLASYTNPIAKNSVWVDEVNPVIVKNMDDVVIPPSEYSITESGNVNTSIPGDYVITYVVSYNSNIKIITKTIQVSN